LDSQKGMIESSMDLAIIWTIRISFLYEIDVFHPILNQPWDSSSENQNNGISITIIGRESSIISSGIPENLDFSQMSFLTWFPTGPSFQFLKITIAGRTEKP